MRGDKQKSEEKVGDWKLQLTKAVILTPLLLSYLKYQEINHKQNEVMKQEAIRQNYTQTEAMLEDKNKDSLKDIVLKTHPGKHVLYRFENKYLAKEKIAKVLTQRYKMLEESYKKRLDLNLENRLKQYQVR